MAHLFVYGTLQPGVESRIGARAQQWLAAASSLVGPATMAGLLFDLGDYPGLIEAADAGDVRGFVLALDDAGGTFDWLDRYEGDDYDRVERTVRLADGHAVTAWVYVLKRRPDAPLIGSGRWPE